MPEVSEEIFHLVYTSFAIKPFNNEMIEDLLRRAIQINLEIGVTGLLVYRQESFMQLLEGNRENVLKIYSKICLDERHH